jgi:hypothetical protein
MKTITFSDAEIAAIRQWLDVALRQFGGQAARAYLTLDGKFAAALAQADDEIEK